MPLVVGFGLIGLADLRSKNEVTIPDNKKLKAGSEMALPFCLNHPKFYLTRIQYSLEASISQIALFQESF